MAMANRIPNTGFAGITLMVPGTPFSRGALSHSVSVMKTPTGHLSDLDSSPGESESLTLPGKSPAPLPDR
jgi:hypothetical protein